MSNTSMSDKEAKQAELVHDYADLVNTLTRLLYVGGAQLRSLIRDFERAGQLLDRLSPGWRTKQGHSI
jgi:hypothetical protein